MFYYGARIFALVLATLPLCAQTASRPANYLWRGSVAALIAGESLDCASSWHQLEANRFWGSRFGTRGLAQSVAINGGVLAGEYYVIRTARRSRWHWPIVGITVAANIYSAAKAARQAQRNWNLK